MQLQQKGQMEGGVRRALQHPSFAGTKTHGKDPHLEMFGMDL